MTLQSNNILREVYLTTHSGAMRLYVHKRMTVHTTVSHIYTANASSIMKMVQKKLLG